MADLPADHPSQLRFFSGLALKIIAIGLIIRLVLAPLLTYPFDVQHWAVILQNIENGNALYGLTGYFYTPVWGYLLGSINLALSSLGSIDLFGIRFTDLLPIEQLDHYFFTATTTTPLFNTVMKLPLIICDLLVGYLIWQMVLERTKDGKKAAIGFGLWFLCPLVIYMSSIQAQFECISALMALLSVVLLKKDHCFLAGTMFALGTLTKLFPAFLVFLFVIYLLRVHREDGLFRRKMAAAAGGALIVIIIVFLPQALDGTLSNAFSFITDRASDTSSLSERMKTYLLAALGLIATVYIAWRMNKLNAEQAREKLYKYALVTMAATGLIAIGPQYCIVFLPLLAYYVAAEDRDYRICIYLIGLGGLCSALTNNSLSLLTSVSEFWGLWNSADLLSWMQVFETTFYGITAVSWLIAIFTVIESAGILLISCFMWADHSKNEKYRRVRDFLLRIKHYNREQHTEVTEHEKG